MPLSSFTGLPAIASGSDATPGLFNSRYSILSQNLDELNAATSNFSSNYSGDIFSNLSNQVFNVRDYGAVGDAVADDTAAIQAAISAATANGGIVFIPSTTANTYLVTGLTLSGASGVALRGDGVQFNAPTLQFTSYSNSAIVEMNGVRYCTIRNLNFDGVSEVSHGINIWAEPGNGSFECRFHEVFVQNCVRGFSIGSTNNIQASEIDLYNCTASSCSYGLEITGQNSLNMRSYGLKLDSCVTGMRLDNGNIVATSTLWTLQSSVDIELGAAQRPNVFLGGDSEQGTGRFMLAPSNGNNFITRFDGLFIEASSSSNTVDFVLDASLFYITYNNCHFGAGAGVQLNGFTPIPSSRSLGLKVFNNCLWNNSNDTVTDAQVSGTATNLSVITQILDIAAPVFSGNTIRVEGTFTPASGTASGKTGDITWDSSYVYVCQSTDSWSRTTLNTF